MNEVTEAEILVEPLTVILRIRKDDSPQTSSNKLSTKNSVSASSSVQKGSSKSPVSPSPKTSLTSKSSSGRIDRCIEIVNDKTITFTKATEAGVSKAARGRNFVFDKVYPAVATQDDIYGPVYALIKSAVDGYNAAVFAYGATGTGKTFTMSGSKSEQGIISRAANDLFEMIEATSISNPNKLFYIEISYVELFNNHFRNLLRGLGEESITANQHANEEAAFKQYGAKDDTFPDKIDIHDSQALGIFLGGSVNLRIPIKNASEAQTIINKAMKLRATRNTEANDNASRSHAVLSFHIEGREYIEDENLNEYSMKANTRKKSIFDSGSNTNSRRPSFVANSQLFLSRLHFIDLAGSDSLAGSKASVGDPSVVETQFINLSLSALGDVLSTLSNATTPGSGTAGNSTSVTSSSKSNISSNAASQKTKELKTLIDPSEGGGAVNASKFTPYKNSKLTHLIKETLGGNSKTLFIVHVRDGAPYYQQTSTSLMYSAWASNIRNRIYAMRYNIGGLFIEEDDPEIERFKKLLEERSVRFQEKHREIVKERREKERLLRELEDMRKSLAVESGGDENDVKSISFDAQVEMLNLLKMIESLRKDNEALTVSQQELTESLNEKDKELRSKDDRIEQMDEELKRLRGKVDELENARKGQDQNDQMVVDLQNRLKEKLDEHEKVSQDWQKKVQLLMDDKIQRDQTIEDLNVKISELSDGMMKRVDSNADQVSHLESVLHEEREKSKSHELDRLTSELSELRQKYQDDVQVLQQKANTLEDYNANMQSEMDDTKGRLESEERSVAHEMERSRELLERINELESNTIKSSKDSFDEMEKLRQDRNNLRKELDELRRGHQLVESDRMREAREKIKETLEENQIKSKQLEETELQLKDLQLKFDLLERQMIELNDSNSKLSNESSGQIEKLKSQLIEKDKLLENSKFLELESSKRMESMESSLNEKQNELIRLGSVVSQLDSELLDVKKLLQVEMEQKKQLQDASQTETSKLQQAMEALKETISQKQVENNSLLARNQEKDQMMKAAETELEESNKSRKELEKKLSMSTEELKRQSEESKQVLNDLQKEKENLNAKLLDILQNREVNESQVTTVLNSRIEELMIQLTNERRKMDELEKKNLDIQKESTSIIQTKNALIDDLHEKVRGLELEKSQEADKSASNKLQLLELRQLYDNMFASQEVKSQALRSAEDKILELNNQLHAKDDELKKLKNDSELYNEGKLVEEVEMSTLRNQVIDVLHISEARRIEIETLTISIQEVRIILEAKVQEISVYIERVTWLERELQDARQKLSELNQLKVKVHELSVELDETKQEFASAQDKIGELEQDLSQIQLEYFTQIDEKQKTIQECLDEINRLKNLLKDVKLGEGDDELFEKQKLDEKMNIILEELQNKTKEAEKAAIRVIELEKHISLSSISALTSDYGFHSGPYSTSNTGASNTKEGDNRDNAENRTDYYGVDPSANATNNNGVDIKKVSGYKTLDLNATDPKDFERSFDAFMSNTDYQTNGEGEDYDDMSVSVHNATQHFNGMPQHMMMTQNIAPATTINDRRYQNQQQLLPDVMPAPLIAAQPSLDEDSEITFLMSKGYTREQAVQVYLQKHKGKAALASSNDGSTPRSNSFYANASTPANGANNNRSMYSFSTGGQTPAVSMQQPQQPVVVRRVVRRIGEEAQNATIINKSMYNMNSIPPAPVSSPGYPNSGGYSQSNYNRPPSAALSNISPQNPSAFYPYNQVNGNLSPNYPGGYVNQTNGGAPGVYNNQMDSQISPKPTPSVRKTMSYYPG